MSNPGMLAAVATAAGLTESAAAAVNVDAAFVAQHFAETATALRAEGAHAERTRLAAMDAVVTGLPGYDALVTAHKADASKTAADLALAVLDAQKAAMSKMAASLDADEASVRGLRGQPANGVAPATPEATAPALAGEALWKHEFATTAALQADFASEADYLALKRAEARGGIKVMGPRTVAA